MFAKQRENPAVTFSYRFDLHSVILDRRSDIGALELTVDHYFLGTPRQRRMMEEIAAEIPMVAHGVGLSLGTDEDLDPRYLDNVASVIDRLSIPYYSEHLAFTGVPGCEISNLLPCPRTDETAERVLHNIETLKSVISVPFLLENITRYFGWPDGDDDEATYLTDICRASGSGILLDVENLCVNETNGMTRAQEFVDQLPADLVWAIHTAGGTEVDGIRVDTHDHALHEDTLALLRYALQRHTPGWVILERDRELQDIDGIFADLAKISECLATARRPPAPSDVESGARLVWHRQTRSTARNLPLSKRQETLVTYLTSREVFDRSGKGLLEHPELTGLDPVRLRLMAQMSRGKRVEKIRAVLPRTFEFLRPSIHDLVEEFAATVVPTSLRRIDNAREFRDFLENRVREDGDVPAWIVDLANYEIGFAEAVFEDPPPLGEPNSDIERIRPRPGVKFLRLAHDVRPLVVAEIGEEAPEPETALTVLAIVPQEAGGTPRVFQLPERLYGALTESDDWRTVDDFSAATSPGSLVASLVGCGIVEAAP